MVVDGVVLASREGGFFKKLFGGGWPDDDAVVQLVSQKVAGTASS